jgi:hypothetical protein
MRIFRAAMVALIAVAAAGCGSGGGLFQQYEYEEDVYLSLDGTATVYVTASVPALNALRGASLDPDFRARLDRDALQRFYTTPVTRVTAIDESRHSGRRFVRVRLDVEDIRRLGEALPFAWSVYDLHLDDKRYIFRQTLGAAAGRPDGNPGWNGREVVAFRLHLPSRIEYHNAGRNNLKRGNILVWEQPLAARLRGDPLVLDAQMQTESILYSALTLFGVTCVAVVVMFGIVIVVVRRSGSRGSTGSSSSSGSNGSSGSSGSNGARVQNL